MLKKAQADRHAQGFTYRGQFVAMLFMSIGPGAFVAGDCQRASEP